MQITSLDRPSLQLPAQTVAEEAEYRLHRRFDRFGRLYGDGAVGRLMGARVVVFGLGGVGSFAAEALVRSAIGHLTIVDFDDVCVTNTNRQLQALKSVVGQSKAAVLADRLREINPRAQIYPIAAFYKAERSDELLTPPVSGDGDVVNPVAPLQYDFVVDCIDNLTAKAHLIAACRAKGIPVISSMGAAAKMDPTRIRLADLSETRICPMARDLRKILRRKYGFAMSGAMDVMAVYSTEGRHWPRELTYDRGRGFRCVCPHKSDEHSCDGRTLIDGTAVFVTGAFGLCCASHVINTLTADLVAQAPEGKSRFEVIDSAAAL